MNQTKIYLHIDELKIKGVLRFFFNKIKPIYRVISG